MTKSIIYEKSYQFAIRVVLICREIQKHDKEYIITKQLLKSGTSIAANIREARFGQSRKDFVSKISISLKEASESEFWIQLLIDTKIGNPEKLTQIRSQCIEILKILTAIVKTTKSVKTVNY